jgi:hypothetical protein
MLNSKSKMSSSQMARMSEFVKGIVCIGDCRNPKRNVEISAGRRDPAREYAAGQSRPTRQKIARRPAALRDRAAGLPGD